MLNWDTITSWHVLVVDDEPDNIEVISESLEFYGMNVTTAENGEVGLEKLKSFKPDLILLDLSMPVMDGWQMLRYLKENTQTRRIPVIALSAHAIVGDRERALEVGLDGYMTKPVNVPTLIDDMKAAFDKRPEGENA